MIIRRWPFVSMSAFGAVAVVLVMLNASAYAADPPATKIDNGWDAKLFAYERPAKLIVEETTPTDEQVAIFMRPRAIAADAVEPKATGPATPRKVGFINVVHLQFRDATGDLVPALLCTPGDKKGPFPLVIATHGLTSNKMQACMQVAPALVKEGFAVLAADLPCHGERPGNPFDMVSRKDWESTFPLFKKAVIDTHQLIDLAGERSDLNTKNGVYLVGYSLGSWMSAMAGPSDERVKGMVLMVGGAFDIPAELLKNPHAAAADPRLAMPHFAGRPLLLLNGKTDGIVAPELSRRLFAASPEPKKQIWYDSGHLLPGAAYADAAKWIADLANNHGDVARQKGN